MTHPHRIRNLALFTLISLTLSVSAVLLLLCYQQARALIFTRAVPLASYAQPPADSGISGYRDVTFTTPDGLALRGWFIPPAAGGATILFVHGHGGGRNQFIDETRLLSGEGYGMLLFDLRNSGSSDGTVTSMGYYETDDVLSAFAWLQTQPEVDAVVLYGKSMGGATAVRAMARLPEVQALIVDTAYTSLRDVVGDGVRLRTGFPASPFAEIIVLMAGSMADANLFDVRPIDDIKKVAPRPFLLMHGTDDEVIPFAHAQRLYDAAGEPKTLYTIENGVHGDSYQRDPERYRETVLPFFASRASLTDSPFVYHILCGLIDLYPENESWNMPINIEWDNEDQTIVRWDFEGLWEWADVYYAAGRSAGMRESVDHPVSVILNMERATPLKPGALTHTKNALQFSPSNRDLVVVVGQSHYVQTMVELFRKMNPAFEDQFLSVETLREARMKIHQRRAEDVG